METSDSECFESADEDFSSEDETQNGKKHVVKRGTSPELVEKTDKLRIAENVIQKSSVQKEEKPVCKEGVTKKEERDLDHIDTDETTIKDNSKSGDIDPVTNRAPPCRTECWEPGVNYDIEKKSGDTHQKLKRLEFGIPPARVGGCFPIIRTEQQGAKQFESKFQIPPAVSTSGFVKPSTETAIGENIEKHRRPEFGIPPARTTCWVPGVTNASNSMNQSEPHPAYLELIKKQKEERNDKSKGRPEFGIPPARTTCWVPGVTNPSNSMNPSEPHPAYLELLKKQKEESNDKSKGKPEFDIPPVPGITNVSNLNQPICVDSKNKQYGKEDDVEIMKQNLEQGQKESQQKVDQKKERSNLNRENQNQDENKEENMWENEDDWGEFEMPSKQDNQVPKSTIKPYSTKMDDKESDENMWEDDEDWEPVESNVQNQLKSNLTKQPTEERSGWGGWSNWGLSSVLSTATTLTTQVSQGITNVLETGIGAPDPEELARINKLEKEKRKETCNNDILTDTKPTTRFGFGNLMHGMTKLVESTGTKVISGGLDTLETIGKKTMEVLQENDPGLKKKRAFLKLDDDKPILSQVLREAKEKAEKENKELEKKHFAKKANYETLFDDHQGLVHLEALEMLSRQCDIKLQSLIESSTGGTLNDMQETMDQVKELCEIPEEDDEEALSTDDIREKLETAVSEINVQITYARLMKTWQEVEDWLTKLNLNVCSKNELHQQAIESLAQLTAIAVEQFHKAGELLLVKEHRSTADEADSLVQLTTTLTALIGIVAARFSEKLNMIVAEDTDKEEVNNLITNVFFEAANSSSYIQDAFQLLIPVLQVGAV